MIRLRPSCTILVNYHFMSTKKFHVRIRTRESTYGYKHKMSTYISEYIAR